MGGGEGVGEGGGGGRVQTNNNLFFQAQNIDNDSPQYISKVCNNVPQ